MTSDDPTVTVANDRLGFAVGIDFLVKLDVDSFLVKILYKQLLTQLGGFV